MIRLSAQAAEGGSANWPGYCPEEHATGIVHLGLGNFARAHLLAYTDSALAHKGGDWRVTGVSLRGTAIADDLNPQNGRYTLLTRSSATEARVIGALEKVLAGGNVGQETLAAMAGPGCRIVSLTVTEKGYGITSDGRLDRKHPAVAADLARPDAPSGVIGLIVAALAQRRAKGLGPFTVLSCDNLSHNGKKLRNAVLEFASKTKGADLSNWIASKASFPSTMVDRITPASTSSTTVLAAELIGYGDQAAVETEPFTQWVIEDDFCAGRPDWECAGALFVDDVAPYEQMKLRMLNGAHSMLAYSGQLSGKAFVRDVMADRHHSTLVRRHLAAAAATVKGLAIDLEAYTFQLSERFANPAIAHMTAQIAMDGSQKLPQRITVPAMETVASGGAQRPFVFALAAWIAYVSRKDPNGQPIRMDDPKADLIIAALADRSTATEIVTAVATVCPDVLPQALTRGAFGSALCAAVGMIRSEGMPAVIDHEATSTAL